MHSFSDEEPVVCRVTPQGDVICDKHPALDDVPNDESMRSLTDSIAKSFPGSWGPEKRQLALNMLKALAESKLPDANIPRRAGDIVQSITWLLDPEPPSILLYNYSTQPANMIGAYYLNKADLVRMQQLYDTFKNPTKP